MDTPPETATDAIRHDGWTPERRTRFLDHLASCGNVRAAARSVGMSRDGAYRLRRRHALFARGWAAAMVRARDVAEEALADGAIHGVEEEVWFRGEFKGTRRKRDTRLLLAHMARLDKLADDPDAAADAGRFDELLACIGGETAPEELAAEEQALPLDRETAALMTAETAEADLCCPKPGEGGGADAPGADERRAVYRAGWRRGQALWEGWFERACARVDRLCGDPDAAPLPGLPGRPLPAPLEHALAAAGMGEAFVPGTVSNVSTSALARSLAGPVRAFAMTPRSRRNTCVRSARR